MKDPGGHGSNGNNSALTQAQGPSASVPRVSGKPAKGHAIIHGGAPMSSNAQAAQSLMSSLKSTQSPVHPAMVSRSSNGGSAS